MDRRHPRVSRETRLLLGIVLLSLASLWVLARVRFPDQPRNPNPVPPVLAQFSPPSPFEAMASAVAELESRVAQSLVRVAFSSPASPVSDPPVTRLAVRLDGARVVLVAPVLEDDLVSTPVVSAQDRASGVALALLQETGAAGPALTPWTPVRAPSPRFLIAAEPTRDGVAFRPVFIGAFMPGRPDRWPGETWRLPSATAIGDGALLFTDDGQFAGALSVRGTERTLLPLATLQAIAGSLGARAAQPRGVTGVLVQDITPLLAAALGVERGVVVSWVDPAGPSAGHLQPLDVIEAVWQQPVAGREQWESRTGAVRPGDAVDLVVRRAGSAVPLSISVVAAAPADRSAQATLGVEVRPLRGAGLEVIRVLPGSSAARAGLLSGDIITSIDGQVPQRAAALARAYQQAGDGRPLAIVVARGGQHRVTVLEKSW